MATVTWYPKPSLILTNPSGKSWRVIFSFPDLVIVSKVYGTSSGSVTFGGIKLFEPQDFKRTRIHWSTAIETDACPRSIETAAIDQITLLLNAAIMPRFGTQGRVH